MTSATKSSVEIMDEKLGRDLTKAEVLEYLEWQLKQHNIDAGISKTAGFNNVVKVHNYKAKHIETAIKMVKIGSCNDTSSLCLNCNDPFQAKTARAKFCSGKCRTAYNRKKNQNHE